MSTTESREVIWKAMPDFGGRTAVYGDEFSSDLAAADTEHRATGEPIEVPPNHRDGTPREHSGLWVFEPWQRSRYFTYPPDVTVFFPDPPRLKDTP